MTDINEVLESEEANQTEVYKPIRSLAIVAFILHGFCLFGVLLAIIVLAISEYDGSLQNQGTALNVVLLMLVLLTILSVLAIVGANKLRKGKKTGFPMLAIGSGLMGAIVLFGAYISWNVNPQKPGVIIGILLIGLVAAFAKNLKYLK
ncbi:MAG: heme/copper-type cytochrome/quinol oxidase subunit 3 [Crocinitomix sp.]|jgi:heme/copper-type cytochrome/quinol oxidase subunit 3